MPRATREQAAQYLREKIDSYEKYRELCNKLYPGAGAQPIREIWPVPTMRFPTISSPDGNREWGNLNVDSLQRQWWAHRELARLNALYQPAPATLTQVIENFRLQPFFIHPAIEFTPREKDGNPDENIDYAMVAYTPDATNGQIDRQVRISFGKLLRKLCPLLTDDHIQKLEAAYRAEVDPRFLVATTPEDIARVYQSLEGDSGCMRYSSDRWGLPSELHPSMAYAAPGMGVAYTTDSAGRIRSRSVIWTNPEDQSDKRYVRIYGDPTLKTKLELAGYRCASLKGALLKRITHRKNGSVRYMLPYLDGPAGAQSDTGGCYVYLDSRYPDGVMITDATTAEKITRMGFHAPQIKGHADVLYTLTEVDMTKTTFVCALSGGTYSKLDERSVKFWRGGEIKDACYNVVIRTTGVLNIKTVGADMAAFTVYYVASDAPPTFIVDKGVLSGNHMIDCDATRAAAGYVRLSAPLYPDGPWAHQDDVETLEDGRVVRKSDVVWLIAADGSIGMALTLEKTSKQLRAEGFLPCLSKDGRKAFVHTENRAVVTLETGKRAVIGFSRLTQTFDGKWVATSRAHAVRVLGRNVVVSDINDLYTVSDERIDEFVKTRIGTTIEALKTTSDYTETMAWIRRVITAACQVGVNGRTLYTHGNEVYSTTDGYYHSAYDEVASGVNFCNGMDIDAIKAKFPGNGPMIHLYLRLARRMMAIHDDVRDNHQRAPRAATATA